MLDSKESLISRLSMLMEKDNFMHVFNFPENMYDSAWAQATGEEELGSPSNHTD